MFEFIIITVSFITGGILSFIAIDKLAAKFIGKKD